MLLLKPDELKIVIEVLEKHFPKIAVRAFGSRVGGKPGRFSDLDLVVMTDQPLELSVIGAARDALSLSDLPFKVDLLDWSCLSDSFRGIIESNCVVIQ